jgi:hypothetical protein
MTKAPPAQRELTGDLASNGCPHLRLRIFEQLYERWHKVASDNLVANSFRQL